MPDMSRDEMLKELNDWLKKIEGGAAGGGGVYAETNIDPGTTYFIDFTSRWPVATYQPYSVSVDVKVIDPLNAARVIPAYNYIDYSISAAGVITFTNNYTSALSVKIKLSGPIKK